MRIHRFGQKRKVLVRRFIVKVRLPSLKRLPNFLELIKACMMPSDRLYQI